MNAKLARLWETKNPDDEWWSSFVTSPLAIAFCYLVADIKWLTPGLITLFSFITAMISAFLIMLGGTVNFILAAILIHLSHIFDCMDGQIARYRNLSSFYGSYFDKLTDQIKVFVWFGSIGLVTYSQSQSILSVYLAFIGVTFYSLRGYIKYVTAYTEMNRNHNFLIDLARKSSHAKNKVTAGLGFGFWVNFRWLLGEQKKLFSFDEGVFIFMLSLALVLDKLTLLLWIFAISQVILSIVRGCQRGYQISRNNVESIAK